LKFEIHSKSLFSYLYLLSETGVFMKHRTYHFCAATISLALATASTFAQTKWDLPAAYPTTNFHTENITQFAADVDKASSGKLKITVHAAGSLFKAPEIKRAVQGGQAQAGEILLVNFENENSLFGVDGLPFLATSYADSKKLYSAQKPSLEKLLASQGMKLLYAVAWPSQGLFVQKEIASASDMKGVKWRAYSPATAKMAELLGAQPVTIQAAEVSQAFATGVVDSMMSSAATGVDSKIYESVKYFYDLQAWLPKNAVIVNLAAFNALDAATQAVVTKAAAEAEVRGWKASAEKNEGYKKTLVEKGMKIVTPSIKLATEFGTVGGTMQADWAKKAGADGQAILDAYNKK
jgi:TRAP-type transport system periplasmic protein